MITRVLPVDEWHKLEGTEMASVIGHVNPAAITVIVAEDENGAVIGCWSLINFVHLEGMWVAPLHRGKVGVLKSMWNRVCAIAQERGLGSVITGAQNPLIAGWIERRGGHKLPFDSFAIPLEPVGRVR